MLFMFDNFMMGVLLVTNNSDKCESLLVSIAHIMMVTPCPVDSYGMDPKLLKVPAAQSDAKFVCYSHSKPAWYFNNGALPSHVTVEGNNLYIKVATYMNSGLYTCAGYDKNNDTFLAKGELRAMCKKFCPSFS